MRAYLEGEREGRAGRVKTAEEALQRAVELDISFALAYYRLAELTWDTEMVNRGLRHSDRLVAWLTQFKGHLLGRAWVNAREPFERARWIRATQDWSSRSLPLRPGRAGGPISTR